MATLTTPRLAEPAGPQSAILWWRAFVSEPGENLTHDQQATLGPQDLKPPLLDYRPAKEILRWGRLTLVSLSLVQKALRFRSRGDTAMWLETIGVPTMWMGKDEYVALGKLEDRIALGLGVSPSELDKYYKRHLTIRKDNIKRKLLSMGAATTHRRRKRKS